VDLQYEIINKSKKITQLLSQLQDYQERLRDTETTLEKVKAQLDLRESLHSLTTAENKNLKKAVEDLNNKN